MKISTRALFSPLFALVVACSSGGNVDLGEDDSESAGTALSDYAGNWDGYAEAFKFSDGSDRVRVTLDSAGHGTFLFGDSPLWPPATDPDVGYPVGRPTYDIVTDNISAGFEITIRDAQVEAKRIRLSGHTRELYSEWCEMQTSFVMQDSGTEIFYNCMPGNTGGRDEQGCFYNADSNGGERVYLDCGKYELCSIAGGPCACTASGCDLGNGSDLFLDAALSGSDELTGTMLIQSQRVTVYLTR